MQITHVLVNVLRRRQATVVLISDSQLRREEGDGDRTIHGPAHPMEGRLALDWQVPFVPGVQRKVTWSLFHLLWELRPEVGYGI